MSKTGKRVAVISGAARGIGQATAVAMARRGENLALLDRDSANETADKVREAGAEALVLHCDVTSQADWQAARDAVASNYGRADILVNCAGIYPFIPFEATDYETWSLVHRINLDGAFLGSRTFTPLMIERGWGRVLNFATASMLGEVPGFTHYISSKMGIVGLTRGMANELGRHGIAVNALAPSVTDTPGTKDAPQALKDMVVSRQPIARFLTPDDLVGPILFFTGDDCAMVTGQTLLVDGGANKL